MKQFFINVETSLTIAEQPVLLLVNSMGTYDSLHLKQMSCVSPGATFKYYLNPTVTAVGPMGTPRNLQLGNPATSSMNVYAGATYSSFGVFLGEQLPDGLVIDQGYELLVTAISSATGQHVSVLASWSEEK